MERNLVEKIELLCKVKNARINNITGIPLYSEKDIAEIKTMASKGMLTSIFTSFWVNMKENDNLSGIKSSTCIWCLVYDCNECTYGNRNGICLHGWGTWDKVSYAFIDAGLSMPTKFYKELVEGIDNGIPENKLMLLAEKDYSCTKANTDRTC